MVRGTKQRVLSIAFAAVFVVVGLSAQQPPATERPAEPPAQPPTEGGGRGGQRGERGGQPAGQQPAAPVAKPLIPVATNTVNANPDAYYGQGVTITAAVEQVLSKSAFAVDQRRVAGAPAPNKPTDVLVLVPTLQSPVDPKSYVTVMGELVKFDPAEIAKKAKDYKLDLPADVIAKYTGRPALIAHSVITDKFVDLAKRLPPPMTADEEALSKVMKPLPPALAALRTAVEASKPEPEMQSGRGEHMNGRVVLWAVRVVSAVVLAGLWSGPAWGQTWVSAWGGRGPLSTTITTNHTFNDPAPNLSGRTLRVMARLTTGGSQVRVRLSARWFAGS